MTNDMLALGEVVKITHLNVFGTVTGITVSTHRIPLYEIEYVSPGKQICYIAVHRHHLKKNKIHGRKNNIINLKSKGDI